jgi:diguanylate cyclase (GGDEF)-like protein
MEPLARLGARLGAALSGAGTEADRLLLLHTATDLVALLAAAGSAAGLGYLLLRRRDVEVRFLLLAAAGAFLLGAGAHAATLWSLVGPARAVSDWTMLAAAAAALGVAIVLWMQLPDLIRIPEGQRLRRTNTALSRENWDLQQKAKRLQEELERARQAAGAPAPDARALEERLAEQTRRADEAVALLQQGIAERQKGEAELARRAEQLERDAARLERIGARLTELTGSDPVTGLVSSQTLAGRLDLAVATARRHGEQFSVLVISADPVDDLTPSDATLLEALGGVLRAELRDTDLAARCDAERICVLLPRAGVADAARVAERVRRRLSATPLALTDARTLRLSCSAGAAEWQANRGIGDLLGQAAEALRTARGRGRTTLAGR